MIPFVLFLTLAAVAAIVLARLSGRVRRLESEQRQSTRLIQTLLARVYELEHHDAAPPPDLPAVQPLPAPPSIPEPPPAIPPVARQPRDWEAIVGGNLLNKLGALVLVVGIGLFLAYSLTHLGPAGKVAIGFALGISMLGAGIALERAPQWSTFGRGFIGGGWAAIYFTTYAMHGLDAARVVDDPSTGTALLLGVSVLMVLHSLYYRSESVTGLAYLISFVTLNITPLTGFTIVASLLLAVSLLFGAERCAWHRLGTAGALLAYGTFGLTYQPAVYGREGVLNGQSVLWIYWVLFESYDLLDLARRGRDRGYARALFWLNAAGFISASALHRWKMDVQDWAIYFALASLAYLVTTLVRRRLLVPDQALDPVTRLGSGGYEGAALVAAGLAAAAIVEQFTGLRASFLLFFLGELVVIAGLTVKDSFLRWLGRLMLLLPVLRLPLHTGKLEIAGHSFNEWTPLAFVMAIAFYIDRFLEHTGIVYPMAAAALLLCVTWVELPAAWVAPVWALGLLLSIGLSRRHQSSGFAWQAYVLAILIALRVAFAQVWIPQSESRIEGASLAIAALFVAHFLLRSQIWIAPLAAIVLAIVLDAEVAPRLITVAWGVEAIALVVAGFALRDRASRLAGLAGFLICIGRLFLHDLQSLDTFARILSFIVLGLILLGASWVYTRYREQIRRYL